MDVNQLLSNLDIVDENLSKIIAGKHSVCFAEIKCNAIFVLEVVRYFATLQRLKHV